MAKTEDKKVTKKHIILVGGCFDILHYGHVIFLKKAKSLGNFLIVALESDKRVRKLKGKGRPIHNQKQRKEILESLKFIDEVMILKDTMVDADYLDLVDKVRPCQIVVTKGDVLLEKKKKQAEAIGAKVVEIPRIKSPSTTYIINKIEKA